MEAHLNLLPHQLSGIDWLRTNPRAILADEMGLGKTVTALMALPYEKKCLVIAPKAALDVWKDHCEVWRPDLKPLIRCGPRFRLPQRNELVITNHDTKFDCDGPFTGMNVIVDEAHAFRGGAYRFGRAASGGTCRWQRLRVASASSASSWLLTGTPLLRDPLDLWSLFSAINIERQVFGSWDAFVVATGATEEKASFGYGFSLKFPFKIPGQAQLVRDISPFVLQRDKSVLDPPLPAKVHRRIPIAIGDSAKIDQLFRLLGGRAGLAQAMKATLKDQTLNELRHELAMAKGKVFMASASRALAAHKPFIAFSDFRAPVDAWRGTPGVGCITGETSAAERSDIARKFQRGELTAVIGTVGSCGTALTLTRAHTVFMIDRSWTPALDDQAEARAHRIGQHRVVTVNTLIADHEADRLLNQVHRKKRHYAEAMGLVSAA
jgi:SNF2 family DNA or RNA helicase